VSRTSSKREKDLFENNDSGLVTTIVSDEEGFIDQSRKIDFSAEIDQ
tara:strand:+ start:305 stop:445 length:141 start_codon:yes stop_codon:yes gene_type:complete